MYNIRKTFQTHVVSYSTFKKRGMNDIINDSKRIFEDAVAAVEPSALIRDNVTVNTNKLIVCDKEFAIDKNCYVVGFGKAVLGMAIEMESILGGHLVTGVVSVPTGIFSSWASRLNIASGQYKKRCEKLRETWPNFKCMENTARNRPGDAAGAEWTRNGSEGADKLTATWNRNNSRITYMEGAEHNLPDAAAEKAAKSIFELAGRLTEKDLLIVLISGGGSALLPLPRAPVTLQEKASLIKLLSRQGADIFELNSVRTRLSQVKGSGLALQAYPAQVVALVLSDVIGDPLDYIASGPTAAPQDASDAAASIIEKYGVDAPESIRRVVGEARATRRATFSHVTNFVIGNNARAASAAAATAKRLGYEARVLSTRVSGDVCEVSAAYARLAVAVAARMRGLVGGAHVASCLQDYGHVLHVSDAGINEILSAAGRACLVAGGEPTVRVRGGGAGGRNQQLALQFAIDVNNALQPADERVKAMNISLLSCGTDGMDGPTDAAGALGTNSLCTLAAQQGLRHPLDYVRDNDCYNFYQRFQNADYLIRTGHTGTNVMDIHLLMIDDENYY